MTDKYTRVKLELGCSPGCSDEKSYTFSQFSLELIDWLNGLPKEEFSSEKFWKISAFAVSELKTEETTLSGHSISLIRFLLDLLRQNPGAILYSPDHTELDRRKDILEYLAQCLRLWGDTISAQSIRRQIAQMYIISQDYEHAFSLLGETIDWMQNLGTMNLLQQAECLERMVHKSGKEHLGDSVSTVVNQLKNRADCQAESSSNICRLIHSAGLLEQAVGNMISAGQFLNNAYETARQTLLSQDEPSSEDVNTALLTAASTLSFSQKMGNLARAEEIYYSGKQIIVNHESCILPLFRFIFRQNAAGFLYRIGDIQEAIRIYLQIETQDYGGKLAGPLGYCAVLSSTGLMYQTYGYPRRAVRYHQKALTELKRICNQGIQYAQTLTHLGAAYSRLRNFDAARTVLKEAERIFNEHNSIENLIRTSLLLARVCNQEAEFDEANYLCDAALTLLEKSGLIGCELHLETLALSVTSLRNSGNKKASDQQLRTLEGLFMTQKRHLKFMRSRLGFSNVFRDNFTESLSESTLPVSDRWDLALRILENDRADLFSDCLSYYVQIVGNDIALPLFETFLELKQEYIEVLKNSLESGQSTSSEATEKIRSNMEDLLDQILSLEKEQSDYLLGESIGLDQMLSLITGKTANDNLCVCAYILSDDCLNILVVQYTAGNEQPLLNHYKVKIGSQYLSTDEFGNQMNLVKNLIYSHLKSTREFFRLFELIPSDIRPEDIDSLKKQYREISRSIRKKIRNSPTVRLLIELSIYALNLSFLLVKLHNLHPETKKQIKSIHQSDLFVFEFLYDLMIRPLTGNLNDNTRLVVLVSEIMTRIPFEALKDKTQSIPDGYFVFPNRSVNYFRSPWLFSKINQSHRSTIEPQDENQYLTLFSPLESDLGGDQITYNLERLITPRLQHDKKIVVQWLKSREATCAAFRQKGENSHSIVVESHSTFDRFQPFLSRLLFAGGEPLTAMDIFAHYTFDVTALMILVACESDQLYDADASKVGVSIAEVLQAKGVERMIAPMWTVERRSSRDLIRRFVEQTAEGLHPVDAFASAQREHSIMRGSHPYFWAAFSYSGRLDDSGASELPG